MFPLFVVVESKKKKNLNFCTRCVTSSSTWGPSELAPRHYTQVYTVQYTYTRQVIITTFLPDATSNFTAGEWGNVSASRRQVRERKVAWWVSKVVEVWRGRHLWSQLSTSSTRTVFSATYHGAAEGPWRYCGTFSGWFMCVFLSLGVFFFLAGAEREGNCSETTGVSTQSREC